MTTLDRLRALREQGGAFPLNRVRVRVSGPDRLRYLNGQLSNDLRRLEAETALEALLLTAKGKLCVPVFVWADDETIVLDAPDVLGETLLARIERYAIADDVSFAREDAAGWHVFGPAAEALSGRKISRLGCNGRDIDQAPEGVLVASPEEVEVLRLTFGKSAWGAELSEDTLPQEALLDHTSVDFHKGCYVGQETVSRLRSVGRVNRLLTGFTGHFPAVSAELFDQAGQPCGRLTSAVVLPGGACSLALGYLSTRASGELFSVRDESGACLGEAEKREFPLSW